MTGSAAFPTALRRWAGATAAALAILATAWGMGMLWFVASLPREAPQPHEATDAIVVLTGGSERLAAGVDLLARGLGRRLFVSGVHRGVELDDLLKAAALPEDSTECCIVLGHAAGDTIGNAEETAAWMRREGLGSLRLVTANYHMRRSMLEFRRALPEAHIVPHPIAPASVRLDEWWRRPGTLRLLAAEYTKFLASACRATLLLDFHSLQDLRRSASLSVEAVGHRS
ncbi:YdcF family protein [Arenibaculum pallidiluteum]|uniref:YdcF family protein n=1 Tax=Arenibaculum pallidiluteum TaxID=2812559 RepID=UPI001A96B597|nr:YdcF family protein [Arenibaculum pallidiluteum]